LKYKNKRMRIIFCVLFCYLFNTNLFAQNSVGEQVASRVANRLQDSLFLNTVQRDSLFSINMYLLNQSQSVRVQHANVDTLRYYLQRIENTRDSLYKRVIADDAKYGLYKQKKRNLISAN